MPKKKATFECRTLILSDVHLGFRDSKTDEVNDVLKHTACRKMILNGDIIDGWSLKKNGKWTKGCTRFVRLVLEKIEKGGTEVVYTCGNHDDMLRSFLPMSVHKLTIVEDHVHETPNGNYLALHGDVFDVVTQQHRYLAVLGHFGYAFLLTLNRWYNRFRAWRGREPFSLAKAIKAKVKGAVNVVSSFEEQIQSLARRRGCVGVICGHIHTPADKMMGDIHYLNSGDWVESLTLLVEHDDGRFEILDYQEFRRRLDERRRQLESDSPALSLIDAASA